MLMNPEIYYSPINWAARKKLFAFHPTPDEVKELNTEAGARYAVEISDPAVAESVLKHFLHHGVDIDSSDNGLNGPHPDAATGWTALHGAALHPNPQAVRLLLAYGANPGLKDRKGRTALDLARSAQQRHPAVDYSEVVSLLATPLEGSTDAGNGR